MSNTTSLLRNGIPLRTQLVNTLIKVSETQNRFDISNEAGTTDRWNQIEMFESQVKDPFNFEWEEDTVSVISSIATALSMLLFIDIAFRVVARVRITRLTKYGIYRYYLMKKVANPLSLISGLFRWRRIQKVLQKPHGNEQQVASPQGGYPRYRKVLIIFTGFLLVAIECTIIFLSTNQDSGVRIVVNKIPSIEVEDRGEVPYIPSFIDGCMISPFTKKPGFKSMANLVVCNTYSFYDVCAETNTAVSEPHFLVQFFSEDREFRVDIQNHLRGVRFTVYTGVSGPDGIQYDSKNHVTPEDCRKAMESIFDIFNVTRISAVRNEYTDGSFELGYVVDPWGISSGYLGYRPEVDIDFFIELYSLMGAIIHTTGRSHGSSFSHMQLTGVKKPFVINQRPYLGVIQSIILLSTLLIISIMLNVIGWEGAIDERWAFKDYFSNTPTVKHFSKGADETLKLDWRLDSNGNTVLGFVKTAEAVQPTP